MRKRHQRKTQLGTVRCGVGLDGVIVIIANRVQKGAAMNTEGCNGIIKDSQNGISLGAGSGRTTNRLVQVAREPGPVGTADRASDATVPDIGRDAGKMESMRALSCENSLAWTASLTDITHRI